MNQLKEYINFTAYMGWQDGLLKNTNGGSGHPIQRKNKSIFSIHKKIHKSNKQNTVKGYVQ